MGANSRLTWLLALLGATCSAGGGGDFPDHWIDGTDPDEPATQVHVYADGTWILRQSLHTNFEAPFLFLLAGAERALLLDTGTEAEVALRPIVDGLIGSDFPLIVAHSHSHGDHVGGDGQFADRPETEVIGHSPQDVAGFFGIDDWPRETARLDLGGRTIDVIPIPGHEAASIALYDEKSRLLLAGDSLYPGRLYVRDAGAYRRSMTRLADFALAREVDWILGTHIEMTQEPGVDYPMRAPTHPSERRLQLGVEHLIELNEALEQMGDSLQRQVHDDFIIFPLQPAPIGRLEQPAELR